MFFARWFCCEHLGQLVNGGLDKSHLIKKAIPDGTYGIHIKDYHDRGLRFSQIAQCRCLNC